MKNKHNQRVGSVVDRSDERIKDTGEVFTPSELVNRMLDQIPECKMVKGSTFLDNSCGSGNFLVALFDRLVNRYGIDADYVREHMLYGVDLMEDNVKETCKRLGIVYGENPHFVCHDALTYDYSFGKDNFDECPLGGLL